MPRQNRVNPLGEIVATPDRGTFMGNRGSLHDPHGRIRSPWKLKRWTVCLLEFKDRKREVMKPGHYTELFFLDEATALAAGHRPCAECRREAFDSFREFWAAGVSISSGRLPTAGEIDIQLHQDRLGPNGEKRTFFTQLGEVPSGVMVRMDRGGESYYLVLDGGLHSWSFGGYGERFEMPSATIVQVVTPTSTVRTIQLGYQPELHGTVSLWP